MTKRELVDEIIQRNHTASAAFLAGFSEKDLAEYLEHLNWLSQPAFSPTLSGGMPARAVAAEKAEAVAEVEVAQVEQVPLRPALQVVLPEPEEEEPAEHAAYNNHQEDANMAEVVAVAAGSESEGPLPFAQESDRIEETYLF